MSAAARYSRTGRFRTFGVLSACAVASSMLVAVQVESTSASLQDSAATSSAFDSVPTIWWAQGSNGSGTFGSGATGDEANAATRVLWSAPNALPRGIPTAMVSAGEDFACGVAAGRAYCWGDNSSGQLGDGTTTPSSVPVAVATDSSGASALPASATVSTVSTATGFACAVADGRAYCWGDNSSGQLGDGTTAPSSVPVAVLVSGSGGSVLPNGTVTKVATGGGGPDTTTGYSCAIAASALYCWGSRENGRLGTGVNSEVPALSPSATIPMWGPAPVTDVSLGGSAACAVAGGRPWCWGWPRYGQLGNGDNNPNLNQTVPIQVQVAPASALPDTALVTEVAVGATSACTIHAGSPYCWGTNMAGQLGADDPNHTEADTTVVSRAVAVARVGTGESELPVDAAAMGLSAGSRDRGPSSYCVLANPPDQGRQVYCWGDNSFGQLGEATTVDRRAPRTVLRQPASALPAAVDIGSVATGNGYTILVPAS